MRCTRRQFLRQVAVAGCGVSLAVGCSGGPRDGEAIRRRAAALDPDLDCSDTGGLWPAEVRTRTDNEYTDRSPHEYRFCFNCSNFVAAATDGSCGSCKTVKGPIHPGGWCTAWTEAR